MALERRAKRSIPLLERPCQRFFASRRARQSAQMPRRVSTPRMSGVAPQRAMGSVRHHPSSKPTAIMKRCRLVPPATYEISVDQVTSTGSTSAYSSWSRRPARAATPGAREVWWAATGDVADPILVDQAEAHVADQPQHAEPLTILHHAPGVHAACRLRLDIDPSLWRHKDAIADFATLLYARRRLAGAELDEALAPSVARSSR